MSGGVAVLLALAGLLLIILGVKGTYGNALGVLLQPATNNGKEPVADDLPLDNLGGKANPRLKPEH